MNKSLFDSTYKLIVNAISGTTNLGVYYLQLPNDEVLQGFTVTYKITNASNENTLHRETKEIMKHYNVQVNINNLTTQPILTNQVFIKNALYTLPDVLSNVKCVELVDEFLDFDPNINTYTGLILMKIVYN